MPPGGGEEIRLKFLATIFLFCLVLAGVAGFIFHAPVGPPPGTPDDAAIYVDVAPGTGARAIAGQLQRAGVVRSRYAFDLLRLLKGGRIPAGEYRFNRPAAATEVYDRMMRGDVYTIALTIPEGYNIFDVAQAVEAAGLGSHDAFLAAERSQTSLIRDLSPHAASLEGYLFPDTYRFGRHATPAQILAAMVKRFRQTASELGLTGAPAAAEQSVSRTIIMASLIEKEVSQDSERPLVAGVFVNRLARGMPLATDPSVIYAALLEGRYHGTIYASDLQSDSAYNTYRRTGLPPGPICNPGIPALRAAISPAHTDYLFFVADAQGHSRFSATLKEHSQQVEQYRKDIGEHVNPAKPVKKAAPARRR